MKSKHFYIYLLLLVIAEFSVMSFKTGLHIDETYSIAQARGRKKDLTLAHLETKKLSEIQKEAFTIDENPSAFVDDLVRLRTSDNSDHTNFYYSYLRLFLIGYDQFHVKSYIFRGILGNIILSMISFLFLFKLMNLIFPDRARESLLAAFIVSLSQISFANVLLMREYQLQETCALIFTFLIFKYYRQEKFHLKDYLIFSVVTALHALAGYFSLIYIFCVAMFFLASLILSKKLKAIQFFLACIPLSVILVFVIYPEYISTLFGYRGNQALNKSNIMTFENIQKSLIYFYDLFRANVFLVISLILAIKQAVHHLIKKQWMKNHFDCTESFFFFSLPFVTSLFLIIFFAPYKSDRYIMAFVPVMSLFFLPAFQGLKTRIFQKIASKQIATSLIFLLTATVIYTKEIHYLYRGYVEKRAEFFKSSDKILLTDRLETQNSPRNHDGLASIMYDLSPETLFTYKMALNVQDLNQYNVICFEKKNMSAPESMKSYFVYKDETTTCFKKRPSL